MIQTEKKLLNVTLMMTRVSEVIYFFNLQDIAGCNMSPVEGADHEDSSMVYLCNTLSGDDGIFTFPSLVSGEYAVVSSCLLFFFFLQNSERPYF